MRSSSLLCFDIFDVFVSWSRINPLKNTFFLSVVSVKLLENMVRRGTKAHNETEEKRWKPPMWNFKKTNSHSNRVNESFSENSTFDGQFCDWYCACFSHNYSFLVIPSLDLSDSEKAQWLRVKTVTDSDLRCLQINWQNANRIFLFKPFRSFP